MANANYRAGRAFEYETIREWETKGYSACRTAGSHGAYDVIAFRPDRVVEFIQCKRTSTPSTANRLIEQFKTATKPSQHYHQVMVVKVKGTKTPITYTV